MEANLARDHFRFPQYHECYNIAQSDAAAMTSSNRGIGRDLIQSSNSRALFDWKNNFQDASGQSVNKAQCDFQYYNRGKRLIRKI